MQSHSKDSVFRMLPDSQHHTQLVTILLRHMHNMYIILCIVVVPLVALYFYELTLEFMTYCCSNCLCQWDLNMDVQLYMTYSNIEIGYPPSS